jgi:2-polyprenyl-3-methyl-5-hydroxy-6-metoxy-1,4-benzoquinol methylase
MDKSEPRPSVRQYDANYGNFQTELYAQIRREAFGEDMGQNSWLTADELDKFLGFLDLSPGKTLIDVACGAGGPALRIAARTGCAIVGIDVHEQGVKTANELAAKRGLAGRAIFRPVDATGPLPFSDGSFDAVTCIDAINHFADRPRVIAEWSHIKGGRTIVVYRSDHNYRTGDERRVAIREFIRVLSFVPHGYDEAVIAGADYGCSDVRT